MQLMIKPVLMYIIYIYVIKKKETELSFTEQIECNTVCGINGVKTSISLDNNSQTLVWVYGRVSILISWT